MRLGAGFRTRQNANDLCVEPVPKKAGNGLRRMLRAIVGRDGAQSVYVRTGQCVSHGPDLCHAGFVAWRLGAAWDPCGGRKKVQFDSYVSCRAAKGPEGDKRLSRFEVRSASSAMPGHRTLILITWGLDDAHLATKSDPRVRSHSGGTTSLREAYRPRKCVGRAEPLDQFGVGRDPATFDAQPNDQRTPFRPGGSETAIDHEEGFCRAAAFPDTVDQILD